MPQRSALVAQVIDVLRGEIARGRWTVGAKLPIESELAADYGISRATLRQAVQALVHVGVLETIQGNGTYVRAVHEVGPVLSRFLAETDDLAILEVRDAIEAAAAELAARRATPTQIETMETLVAAAETAGEQEDDEAVAKYSVSFHRAVVDASANPVLSHLYDAVDAATAHTIERWTSAQTPEAFQSDHRAIIAAIREGDGERARQLSRSHLEPVIAAAATRR